MILPQEPKLSASSTGPGRSTGLPEYSPPSASGVVSRCHSFTDGASKPRRRPVAQRGSTSFEMPPGRITPGGAVRSEVCRNPPAGLACLPLRKSLPRIPPMLPIRRTAALEPFGRPRPGALAAVQAAAAVRRRRKPGSGHLGHKVPLTITAAGAREGSGPCRVTLLFVDTRRASVVVSTRAVTAAPPGCSRILD